MSNTVPQPKKFNNKKYLDGYDQINWDDEFISCWECGQVYKKIDKDKYMRENESGDWVCGGKECNYN